MQDFKKKYLKYKAKYLQLKDLLEGGNSQYIHLENYGNQSYFIDKAKYEELKSNTNLTPRKKEELKSIEESIKKYEDFKIMQAKQNCKIENNTCSNIKGCAKGKLFGCNLNENEYLR